MMMTIMKGLKGKSKGKGFKGKGFKGKGFANDWGGDDWGKGGKGGKEPIVPRDTGNKGQPVTEEEVANAEKAATMVAAHKLHASLFDEELQDKRIVWNPDTMQFVREGCPDDPGICGVLAAHQMDLDSTIV